MCLHPLFFNQINHQRSWCVRLKRQRKIESPESQLTPPVIQTSMTQRYNVYQLSHCTWICQYHVVWTPKYRGRVMKEPWMKAEMKRILKLICSWKGVQIRAWHVGDDHIHLILIIPPKHSVSYIMSVMKAKSSAWIKKKTKKLPRGPFWGRGYFVSTIGLNSQAVYKYVRNQQHHQIEPPEQLAML